MVKKNVDVANGCILIAEDDAAILEVMTIILEDSGYRVKAVQHYKDLQKIIQQETVLLVLLDLWLSGENGSDICRAIKNNKATEHMPVIILSAHQQVEKIAHEVSADDVLQKPFDIDVLLKKVMRFVPLHQ